MFVVLEGLDGAGKSTQVQLLRRFFEERGAKTEYLHFPRFDAPVYGELIARFLRGEFGAAAEVNSYLVALIFAGDRAEAATRIRTWLDEGRVVLLDRYVYSNIAYQCAKLEGTDDDRRHLKQWILNLEYTYNRIPHPDVSLFLDVPMAFVERKLAEQREGDDRDYLKGRQDIHEASIDLQRRVRATYLDAATSDEHLRVVDCSDLLGAMHTPEMIFARICEVLTPYLK